MQHHVVQLSLDVSRPPRAPAILCYTGLEEDVLLPYRANPLSLGVWHFTMRFILPGVGLATRAEGRQAVVCSHPLDPKSTQSFPAAPVEEEEEEEFT